MLIAIRNRIRDMAKCVIITSDQSSNVSEIAHKDTSFILVPTGIDADAT